MPSIKHVEVSEETFMSGSSGTVHPIAQDKRKGLATLPSELLLEIAAYFPEISTDDINNRATLPFGYRQRFAALQALSQTCKELRDVVLPLAWERLEACVASSATFCSEEALERKCKGLLQNSYLIPYVRILTISFTNYRIAIVLPSFVECLQALTNLYAIQIVGDVDGMEYLSNENAFEGHTFISVRMIILPTIAQGILSRCPNVEDLIFNDLAMGWGSYGEVHISNALTAVKLTKLKTLRRILPSKDTVERLAAIAPNLQLIRIYTASEFDNLELSGMQNFKNLDTIEIQFSILICMELLETYLEIKKTTLVQIAGDFLKASKSTKQKRIRLLYTCAEGDPPDNLVERIFKEETLLL